MNQVSALVLQYQKLFITGISILLVIAMSWSLANSVSFFMDNLDQATFTSKTATKKIARTKTNTNISKLNIFGKTQTKTTSRKVTNVPKTSLNLELQGIFVSDNTIESRAVVATKGKKGELFKIGDKLPGNAILNAIFDTHILIKRGARIEKLAFSEGLVNKQTTQLANQQHSIMNSPQRTSSRLQNVRERIAQRSGANRLQKEQNAYRTADLQQSLLSFQNRLNSDPSTTLAELGVSAIKDNAANGYKIGTDISKPLLQQSGLQQGDVILSVNGKAVGNIANDQNLISQVMAASRARVEVQRGSRKFYVTIPIPK